MGLEFSLRFAENAGLWLMLWFFTDSIVNSRSKSNSSNKLGGVIPTPMPHTGVFAESTQLSQEGSFPDVR